MSNRVLARGRRWGSIGTPRMPSGKLRAFLSAALLLSVAAGYSGYQRFLSAKPDTTAVQTTPATVGSLVSTVTATGNVVFTKQSNLGFSASSTASGKITEIDVKVGDSVKAGQQLAKLDTQGLQAQLDQADSNLQTAQINLQEVKDGATPEARAAAQAAYASALANYKEVAAGVTGASLQSDQVAVESAQANLASAQAKLDAVKNPYTQADWAAARAAVDSAASGLKSVQIKLDQLKSNGGYTTADLASQQAAVDQAKQAMMSAEDKYQTAQHDLAASGASSVSAAGQSYNAAKASYEAEVQKLQQMMSGPLPVDLQAAQTAVDQAQASYSSALAKLDQMKAGPLPTDLALAQSSVDQAQANLASAQTKLDEDNAGPKAADVAAAKSSLAQAKANLTTVTGPPLASNVALAEQTVKQAQANYDQAKLNLANAVLTAPYDGVITAVNANVGEQIGASPLFTLVDTSQVRIDGTVDEIDVPKLAVGQAATVTFDALPGTTLNGKVIAISPSGTATQGVVSYPVSVSVDTAGKTLLAGMSATISIVTDRKDNVLLVPARAIHTRGTTKTVQVKSGNKTETRTVHTGSFNGTMIEITSGLQAGEQVVIPTTTTKLSSTAGGPGIGVPGIGGPPPPPVK